MNEVIDTINKYKTRSVIPLHDEQLAYIPAVTNQAECAVYSYVSGDRRCMTNQTWQACFRLRYLNFTTMTPRKRKKYMHGAWPMLELIEDEVLYPFLFFLNGVFIPWELITVAIGYENYLIIDATKDENFRPQVRNLVYAQMLHLPYHIDYVSHPETVEDKLMFGFNEVGEFDMENVIYAIYSAKNNRRHIQFQWWNSNQPINALKVVEENNIKLSADNVVMFVNKKFATGIKAKIPIAQDGTTKPTATNGPHPCYEFTYSEESITTNPVIRFDMNYITINGGENPQNDVYDFGIFSNHEYTPSIDNITRVVPSVIYPEIKKQINGEATVSYLEDLQKPFEMKMDRTKKYADNVANAIKTMMSYNTSLFNETFKRKSNLVIEEYTGKWINDNTRSDGTIIFSRQHNEMVEEHMLMFVNGLMYPYYKQVKYRTNQCIIPIQGINDTDIVELFRFQNVNNTVLDIVVNENDGFVKYDDWIINEDMILFSPETDTDVFDFPADGLQHFPLAYQLQRDRFGRVKIILGNQFYYGKPLKVAYVNRFQHFWFDLKATPDKYTVNLGDKFMYCPYYNRFMVFYNGRRLGSDYYRLTLPVRPSTPFTQFDIYLTMPILEGDRLDVIYTPSLMLDVATEPSIPLSGDIAIDKNEINYGLSNELYTVWINGKKVPQSKISDIDSRYMRVLSGEKSTQTVLVTEHIPPIEALTAPFKNNIALWDAIIDRLTPAEVYKLLGINAPGISNTDPSVYEGSIHIRSIMYELIREQYVMNPRVDITKEFVYDYQDVDKTAIDGKDSGNNPILPVADASRTDNLDNVERPWP